MTKPEISVYIALPSARGLFSGKEEEWSPGGAEVQMWHLAKGFAAAPGIEVVLIENEELPMLDIPGIRIKVGRPPIKHGLPLVSRIINRRRNEAPFREGAKNKVFLQTVNESAQLTDAARRMGAKTMYRINGDSLVDGSTLHPDAILAAVHSKIRSADLVVVQTVHQREMLRMHHGVESVVVGQGVEIRERSSKDYPPEGYALWVGRCDPIKRPWVFIELARRIPDRQFVMVLAPVFEFLGRTLAAEASEISNLQLIEGASHRETLDLYHDAAVVVNTSISEGFPNVFIEAALASRPVLSYKINPDLMFSDECIGLCAEDDFERLVTHLGNLFDDRVEGERMGIAARQYADKYWDMELVVGRYLKAIRTLFDGDAEHGPAGPQD